MADYSQQWRDYRRLRNQALLAIFGIIPVGLLMQLLGRLFGTARVTDFVSAAIILAWFFAALFTGARVTVWPCPRCGKNFGFKWWYKNSALIARRCAHCGLAKFANN
jgi:hypothetical protein